MRTVLALLVTFLVLPGARAGDDAYAAHLASYRTVGEAKAGWQRLEAKHPEELRWYAPMYRTVDLSTKGTFVRLFAGPPMPREDAVALCRRLQIEGGYCAARRTATSQAADKGAGDALPASSSSTGGSVTLGRWCDATVPSRPKFNRLITIQRTADGGATARVRYAGGKVVTQTLQDAGGGLLEIVDSTYGDGYRLSDTQKMLALEDSEGFIRYASRMRDGAKDTACVR